MSTENLSATEAQALTVVPRENAAELMKRTTDIAGVCKDIVLKTACQIQGKKYIKAEGWMAIATAHGCIASSKDVKKVEGGFTAIGEIKRISDGVVLSTAEGFVGRDEKRWGSADEYACRAMCQTRAISRACRAAFAHIVVLMDAGLSTTPFEEVPDGGFKEPPERFEDAAPQSTLKGSKTPPAPTVSDSGASGDWRNERITFGKNKGKQLGELSDKSLLWYIEECDKGKDTPLRRALDTAQKEMAQKEMEHKSDEPPF